MQILISLSESLTPHIKKLLIEGRRFWRDLPMRLERLPIIKRGINIGILPRATVHDNAVAYSKKNKLRLYVGYLVSRETTQTPWIIEVHSFCVDSRERVIEPTAGFNWEESYYLGIPVPEEDIRGMRYLHNFEKMSYINKVAPDVKARAV